MEITHEPFPEISLKYKTGYFLSEIACPWQCIGERRKILRPISNAWNLAQHEEGAPFGFRVSALFRHLCGMTVTAEIIYARHADPHKPSSITCNMSFLRIRLTTIIISNNS